MSLSSERAIALMALADGEIEGEAAFEVQRLADADGDARRLLAAFRSPALGELLREGADRRAEEAEVDALAEQVIARLHREHEGPRLAHRIPLSASRHMASRAWAGLGVSLAVAATVALVMAGRRPRVDTPVARIESTSSAAPAILAARPEGVEVDDIDSPGHGISVFEIDMKNATASAEPARGSSVVIWVEEGDEQP